MPEECAMDNGISSNGHAPEEGGAVHRTNPYAEALIGSKPPELVEFELHTDPYANMLPRVSSVVTSEPEEIRPEPQRRNPVIVAVSVLLIAVLVLPVMFEVFARLVH
jgi:hypothetical protein